VRRSTPFQGTGTPARGPPDNLAIA